jgi:hypothetical protein
MQGYDVQQSTTAYPLVFLLISSTDHITGLTGATVTATLSKSGAAFGAPAGAVSEIGSGWYKVAGNATDTATLGPLALHATATGADPTDALYPVVAYNPQSATSFVTSVPSVVGAVGSVTGAVGSVTGAVASVTGAVGSVTGKVGGNVTGSVASVVGAVGSVTGLTTATIATAILTDTGDNATTGSPGKILAQLLGALTGTTSVFTTASLVNAPTGGSAPTTAQIATAVWHDLVAGSDFSTAGSIGLQLVTGSPVLLTQTLSAARALDAIADTSLTLNDVGHCAIAAATGKQSISGTTYTIETPSTATVLRTFTLNSATAPTSRS